MKKISELPKTAKELVIPGYNDVVEERNNPEMARLNVSIFPLGNKDAEITIQRSDSMNHLTLSIVEAQALFEKMKECDFLNQ